MYNLKAKRLNKYYDQAIRRPDTDRDEAVEYAVKQVYPMLSEDAQADLFAMIRPLFDEYSGGLTRRIALTAQLRQYEYNRRRGV